MCNIYNIQLHGFYVDLFETFIEKQPSGTLFSCKTQFVCYFLSLTM